MALQTRAEVPVEETWDLTPLFKNEDAFDASLQEAEHALGNLAIWHEEKLDSGAELLAMLEQRDTVMVLLTNIERYASQRFSEDASSSENQARYGRVQMLMDRYSETVNAVRGQLSNIPADVLFSFRNTEPGLKEYSTYLDEVVSDKKHRLSDDGEAVLSSLSSLERLPNNVYQAASAADMTFAPVVGSNGEEVAITPFFVLMNIEVSTDNELRRKAYQSLTDGLRPHQHTLAAALGGNIQRDVTLARLRKYPSVFDYLQNQSSDTGMAPNAVGAEHFFMVQDIMMKELAPHMRRYARLRKKVLGLEQSLLCDVKAPLESLQGSPIEFGQAKDIILNAAAPLGDEYAKILRRAFDERWIYRARNVGQVNSAFCSPTFAHPYVFSPFAGQLYDVLILGHELGHAVHLGLSYEQQKPINTRFSTLFVETPSTLMEHFIVKHLRETESDPSFLRRLTMLQLFTFHHNFVTHQLEAEILRRLYLKADSGEPLTTNVFRQLSRQTLSDFWGDAVELDESADVYWMRQPHYYSGIYAYTYAVGLVGSTVIAKRIMEEGDSAVRAWVEVVKSGVRYTPMELYKMAGVDMTSPDPYREAVAYVGQLIDELEKSYE